ncbi:diguanylate cyclase domain-containing protein [Sphingomonas floccifaciens]|uniref:diguanylate cyclase n=1 Tax=Sphingomonas floccifaciens TaxID=1844115 RepID=A0ABW4NBH7_9SPHN
MLAFACAVLVQDTRAQAGLAGTPIDACIARALRGQTADAMFTTPRAFDCTTSQITFGPGDYWVRSSLLPADMQTPHLRARVGSLWQDALTLNILYSDGKIVTIRRSSHTISRNLELGAIVEFALPYRGKAKPVRLLWRVDGSVNIRGILIGQRLADASDSTRANLAMAAIYAAFGGLAFALLVYNLSLWWALRYRFQLAYCGMVAMLVGYAVTSSGLLAWLAPAIDNNDRMRLNYILLGSAAAAAVAFARCFFEERIFTGWLRHATRTAILILAISGPVFAIGSRIDMRIADRATSVLILTGLSVTAPILLRAWRRSSRYLWLFALAWSLPIASAAARLMNALHLIPTSFWLDNSTILALTFEALISSLAIAYRVQTLSQERDEAIAAEMRARTLADADPLTGLLNRRAFLDRFIGADGHWTLHLVDIDYFKSVNETLGHDGGDEVLRVFARTLLRAAPAGAMVSRLGGEEFAIVSRAGTKLDAETLLDQFREARMPFDLRVTASVGSCTGIVATEADWKLLYRNADRALFDAKRAGRDRARTAPPLAAAA